MKTSGTSGGLLLAVGIAVAFGAGYLVAIGSGGNRKGDDHMQRPSSFRPDGVSGEERGSNRTGGKSWPELKERVFARWNASPAVMVDFELSDETLGLLEGAPVADLEAWMRELDSDIDQDDDKNIPLLLRETIMMVLAQRCGGDFIRSLADRPLGDGEDYVDEAMFHWIRHDPAAALDWLDGGDLPEKVAEDIEGYREDALVELSGKDPDEFERCLGTVDSDTRESALEDYAYRRGTQENRADILERAASSPDGEAMALWEGLIRREVAGDPKRGYATLKELDISDSDRKILDERMVISQMNGFSFYGVPDDIAGIMQDWADRNPGQEVSDRILSTFESWSQSDTGKAGAWVMKQSSGLRYDAFARIVIGQRADENEENHRELADIAGRIRDPNIRAEANRRIRESWQAKDAEAAARWENGLPTEDRERLR